MTLLIFIQCNATGCTTVSGLNARSEQGARTEAANGGWTSRTRPEGIGWKVEDRCPEHPVPGLPAHPYRVRPENCISGDRCPARFGGIRYGSEVYDWCGHDRTGHQLANALVRAGLNTIELVQSADPIDIADLRSVGTALAHRWKTLVEVSVHGA